MAEEELQYDTPNELKLRERPHMLTTDLNKKSSAPYEAEAINLGADLYDHIHESCHSDQKSIENTRFSMLFSCLLRSFLEGCYAICHADYISPCFLLRLKYPIYVSSIILYLTRLTNNILYTRPYRKSSFRVRR